MRHLYTLILAATVPILAHGQNVLIYQNSFDTPLAPPTNASCQQDFSDTPVNTLWQGTGAGTFSGSFQQTGTVETLLINGPADIYDDPAGNNGDHCLGMLNTHFGDKLVLLIDREGLPFVNLSMDMSAINTTCGGPFTLGTPNFLIEILDAPGGVFDINSTTPISADTLVGIAPTATTGAGSFVFNWANAIGSLDVSAGTDDFVAVRFTLLNTGSSSTAPIYSAFDNIYIEASTDSVISSVGEHSMRTLALFPNPATDVVTLQGVPVGTTVQFVTLTGRTAAVFSVGNDSSIQLAGLAHGTYVARTLVSGTVRQALVVVH